MLNTYIFYLILAESWAIFDQPNIAQEAAKDKQNIQSEEGVSPWSSDSKEFGNGSPPEWRPRGDSGSDHWARRPKRDQEGWWDTSAEPEGTCFSGFRHLKRFQLAF